MRAPPDPPHATRVRRAQGGEQATPPADARTAPPERSVPEPEHWLQHWFPVAFSRDLPGDKPVALQVHGLRFVLFRGVTGALSALRDRCPHRGAHLSDGRVVDGEVECLYHGWRFAADGQCTDAPQLETGATLSAKSCAKPVPVVERQGIAWLWAGAAGLANPDAIQTLPGVDIEDGHCIDFSMDLPYGQDYFIENVLDVAHIHIAHAETRGGGSRALAGPLAFDIEGRGQAGFAARFHSTELPEGASTAGLIAARAEFHAPNLVHYVSEFEDRSICSGLALYSIPISESRCRMLYRAYGNNWTESDRRRSRWREHGSQCHLLEQDMAVVIGQSQEIDGTHETLASMWLPLKSSDALVIQYREWIDRHALDRPGAIGLREVGQRGVIDHSPSIDRWTLHTRSCLDCAAALHRFEVGERWLPRAAFGALAIAAITTGGGAVAAVVVSLALQVGTMACRRSSERLGRRTESPRPVSKRLFQD